MNGITSIYDSDPIQPVAKFQENLSVLTLGNWQHFKIKYVEPIPAGPVTLINFGPIAGNATVAKQIIPILQLLNTDMLQLRFKPIDNLEAVLWEQGGQAKFYTRNLHARVDVDTIKVDPNMSTTTFFIYGEHRDMQMEVRNPLGVALPIARVQFWGIRYVLIPLDMTTVKQADKEGLRIGDPAVVRRVLGGPTTWLPAEGHA